MVHKTIFYLLTVTLGLDPGVHLTYKIITVCYKEVLFVMNTRIESGGDSEVDVCPKPEHDSEWIGLRYALGQK